MPDIHSFEPFWGGWYIVEPPLGRGSYGTVYRARKSEFEKEYYSAIKHIKIPVTDELYGESEETRRKYYDGMLHTLMQEIEINNRLKGHTNIVSYEEHFISPRESEPGYDVFIKMELLTSLTSRIQNGPVTLGEVVRLGEDICTALKVLRQEHIVHRDIKPTNILVHSGGHFKLGDFGVARTLEQTVSNMSIKGSPAYMAPEVWRDGEGDYRVDIYSLGLVLYRLLNGNRPPFLLPPPASFDHDSDTRANNRRLQGEDLPGPALADERLSAIVLKACAYRPEDRYPDAAQLRSALMEYEASLSPEQLGRVVLGEKIESAGSGEPEPGKGTEREPSPLERTPDVFYPEPSPYLEPTIHQKPPVPAPPAPAPPGPGKKRKKKWPIFFGIGAAAAVAAAVIILAVIPQLQNTDTEDTPDTPPPAPSETIRPSPAAKTKSSPLAKTKHSLAGKPAREPGVVLADEGLDAYIRETLGLGPEEELTLEMLEQIDELRIGTETGFAVYTLEDLSVLPNLKTLDIKGQRPDSLRPIAELSSLTGLNLGGCALNDDEILYSLPAGIQNLDLRDTGLTSLQFASRLEQLSYLNISGNSISDLTPLASLARLSTLAWEGNPISDWSPVEHVQTVTPAPPAPTVSPPPAQTWTWTPPPSPAPTPTETPPPTPAPVTVTGVSLNQSSALLAVGGSVALRATVFPSNATDTAISWSSSNPGVAAVDGSGNVTAVGPGSAAITASCGGHSATCSVTVS